MKGCKKEIQYYCVFHVLLELGWWSLKYNFTPLWEVLNSQSPNPLLPCSPPPPFPCTKKYHYQCAFFTSSYCSHPGTDLHVWHVHKSIWEKSNLYSSYCTQLRVAHPIWIYQCIYFFLAGFCMVISWSKNCFQML